jgi:hypothetical protein
MTDTTVDDEDLVRLAIGGRKVRRQRLSQLALARLLGLKKGEQEDDEGEDEEIGEDGGDLEHRLARLVIGKSVVRRARLRRLLLAHLLREKHGEEDEGEEGTGEDGGHEDRRLVRLLIGRSVVRRARLRRLLLAHLLRERLGQDEGEGEGEEDEEGSGEDGEHEDRRLVRLLIGKSVAGRSRLRKLLLAQLLRGREESVEEEK